MYFDEDVEITKEYATPSVSFLTANESDGFANTMGIISSDATRIAVHLHTWPSVAVIVLLPNYIHVISVT